MFIKRSKSNKTTANYNAVVGSKKRAVNFTVVIHELIVPVFDDDDAATTSSTGDNANGRTNALRAIAWHRGNKKSGVTRSVLAKPSSHPSLSLIHI